MSEIVAFVNRGASSVSPAMAQKVLRRLPLWKAEFTQLQVPKFPHLVDQLEFLADVVEDSCEGAYLELPYHALAAAVFALTYAHRELDLIPDHMGERGRADDSSVVRAVLIQHEKAFARYAEAQGVDWPRIGTKA
jgi:uncharacterized membrane protein YkvA (DUF1232 family)